MTIKFNHAKNTSDEGLGEDSGGYDRRRPRAKCKDEAVGHVGATSRESKTNMATVLKNHPRFNKAVPQKPREWFSLSYILY